jgi:tRNA (cytidine/uridine-2'-O-)-methyltransferase
MGGLSERREAAAPVFSEHARRTFALRLRVPAGRRAGLRQRGHGLPPDFYARYRDRLFRIPMPGEHARSINLANAVSIAAYEAYRQTSRP